MIKAEDFFFGRPDFGESEEYQEFQFKFLCVVLLTGGLFTSLFLFGEFTGLNRIKSPHLYSMSLFTIVALILWAFLRGHKQRFTPIAWLYEAICLIEYTSALAYVPSDELRILWFFVNVPGVYILLGQRAGLCITAATLVGLTLGNGYISAPYSQNAMATAIVSLTYLGVFFHVYGNRSISYFIRLRESSQRLRHMAMHDTLTGVMNARAYYDNCDRLIGLAHRKKSPYAVLFVDLDHFKQINDSYGHEAGDVVLKAVANALAQSLRASDALGRIGGEEFSIFLPETDLGGAMRVAESIRRAIEALEPRSGEKTFHITASIGVAICQHSERSMSEIQRLADQAMYRAKEQGRNRVSTLMDAA